MPSFFVGRRLEAGHSALMMPSSRFFDCRAMRLADADGPGGGRSRVAVWLPCMLWCTYCGDGEWRVMEMGNGTQGDDERGENRPNRDSFLKGKRMLLKSVRSRFTFFRNS